MNTITKHLPKVLFITGTGTDVGKTYATGWLARKIAQEGKSVITQKLIQTGNRDMSEDIEAHRRIMGIGLLPRDIDHTTAPIILSYPASPHLAAMLDNVTVDWSLADNSTAILSSEYDHLLIEGAGGLLVPLDSQMLTADYIAERNLPTAVVVGGNLGSINHALLTLSEIKHRGIELTAVIYNKYFDSDKIIAEETRRYLREYCRREFPGALYIEMPDNDTV